MQLCARCVETSTASLKGRTRCFWESSLLLSSSQHSDGLSLRQRGRGDREKVTDEERRKVTRDLRSVDVSQYTTERMDNGDGRSQTARSQVRRTLAPQSLAGSTCSCVSGVATPTTRGQTEARGTTARTVAQRSSTLSGGYVESLRGNEVEEHGAWGLRPHPCRTF